LRASSTRLRVALAIAPVISIRAICFRKGGLKGQIMGSLKVFLSTQKIKN